MIAQPLMDSFGQLGLDQTQIVQGRHVEQFDEDALKLEREGFRRLAGWPHAFGHQNRLGTQGIAVPSIVGHAGGQGHRLVIDENPSQGLSSFGKVDAA